MTPSSPGYPTAKWIWFLSILFNPVVLISSQAGLLVPWTTVSKVAACSSVTFLSSSSSSIALMVWPWAARIYQNPKVFVISNLFLSLFLTTSDIYSKVIPLKSCRDSRSSNLTYPSLPIAIPSFSAPCLNKNANFFDNRTSLSSLPAPPPNLFLLSAILFCFFLL